MVQSLMYQVHEALNSNSLVAIDYVLEAIQQAKLKNISINDLDLLAVFSKAILTKSRIPEIDWNDDIVSTLFSADKFSLSQKQFIAVSFMRLISKNDGILDMSSNLKPLCFKLVDDVLSEELYKFLNIEIKMQNYEKESKIKEALSKLENDITNLISYFKDLDDFQDFRNKFLQKINNKLSQYFIHPFLPEQVVLRLKEIFSILEKYLNEQDSVKIDTYNEANKVFEEYIIIAKDFGTKYSCEYLVTLLSTIQTLLQKDFRNSPLGQPTVLEISSHEKKYPFSRIKEKFNLNLIIKNSGCGQAFSVNLNVIELSHNIRVYKKEFYLGNLSSMSKIDIEIPCEVITSDTKADLLGELIWNNFDNSNCTKEFEIELVGQNSNINWESLNLEEPYSLEPVETEDDLVGRKDVLDQLIRSANSKNSVGSSYIYGQKRVGKTSIAKTLTSRLSKLNNNNYLVIYLEGGEYSSPNATETIENLGRKICKKIQKSDIRLSHLEIPEFKGALSRLSDFLEEVLTIIPEYKILFILDEFDELPLDTYKYTPVGQSFFLTLRAISSKPNFGFLLVGGEKMEFIISVQGDALNKFQPNRIDYFANYLSDFQDIVRKPIGKWGIEISDKALYELYQETGGNPYFTKQICRELFKLMVARRDGHITPKEIK
ncbi:MAG: hypothetical protein AN482_01590 [Anabaena sp. LE011-02]|nr:MAG: hypothetical protein AN482_01590 [Anabaena sp. LE011-02]